MIKTLEDVLERVKSWPKQRQEDAARVLETMEQSGTGPYQLSNEERAAVEIGLDQAKRGEFLSDADMAAFWNRNRASA
jgi:predicted transcriptional regulator